MNQKKWVLVALLSAASVFLALPYFVAYVLPVIVIGLAVGRLWLRGCYVSPSDRRYARLVLVIPATFAVTLLSLQLMGPTAPTTKPEKRVSERRARAVVIESPDPWALAFTEMSSRWYVATLGWAPARPSFGFEHVAWIVWIAVGFGGPIGFALLYPRD